MSWFRYIGFDYDNGVLREGFDYPVLGLEIEADTAPNEEYELITDVNYLSVIRGSHYIESIKDPLIAKDFRNLNLDTDLISGVSINYEFKFNNDGSFREVLAKHGNNNVCKITFSYIENQSDLSDNLPPSLTGVIQKKEIHEFFFEDGQTLDSFDTLEGRSGMSRVTSKEVDVFYPNLYTQLQFGSRKREQLQIIASEKLAIATIVLGIFSNDRQAKRFAQRISDKYDRQFNQFKDRATDTIFNRIQNDTANNVGGILDNVFPALTSINSLPELQKQQLLGAIQLYGLEDMLGKTLRDYTVGKLRGELK